jgi:single-stranded-DNA-specific exonuclease
VQTTKQWKLIPHDPAAIERLGRLTRLPPIVSQLLLNRGITEADQALSFLQSPLTGLHPPEQLPGAAQAAERVWQAVKAKDRVCIYGDYDADGITGTAILLQVLTALGAVVDYYLPNRLEEGYGLNAAALQDLSSAGTKVVITVDCGIAAIEEAVEARRLGIDLIVTDHHEFKETLPCAAVCVHPRLTDSQYPFSGLSGAGVAFKLAWLIGTLASGGPKVTDNLREILLDAVCLAAIGLVADVMPLRDENRVLVKHGLNRFKQKPPPGLKALLASAGLAEAEQIRAEDVAFKIAPRLNAAGRLGCARMVVELLTTPSEQRAKDLATFLEGQNQQRQFTERKILAEAREMAAQFADAPALVLASADWHAGVVGIVAGRLADQFGKPTLLMAIGTEEATGSGRSIPGFELHQALAECDDILVAHGGHSAAAGFRLAPSRIKDLRERFVAVAARFYPQGPPVPQLALDAEVPLAALTHNIVKGLDALEPYGAENPRPRFLAAGLQVVDQPRKMGAGERHLNLRVSQGGTRMRAVGWGMAERMEELMSAGGKCCLAFIPKVNTWNGYSNVELEIVDFQPGPTPQLT